VSDNAETRALEERKGAENASDEVDTSYGRIDARFRALVGLGAVAGNGGLRPSVELHGRYYEHVGGWLALEDNALFRNDAQLWRVASAGVQWRPLFFGRWLTGREFGNAFADLTLDSLALDLGGFTAQTRVGGWSDVGFQLGAAVEIPLLAKLDGPWLGVRAGMRWGERAFAANGGSTYGDRAAYVALTLMWSHVFAARH